MKKACSLLALIIFILASSGTISACSCVVTPLSKRFRNAEAIFVGRAADYDNILPANIQNYVEGRPVLEVGRSWKGIDKKYVAVDFDLSTAIGGCPSFWRFEEGRDYLVFAYGRSLEIQISCSDTKAVGVGYSKQEMRRLDSFWFRTKTRFWPF